LPGRGRIRTAGSRRDANRHRSLPDVIVACGGTLLARLAPSPTCPRRATRAHQRVAAAISRRENGHGTLETRSTMVDANDGERCADSPTVVSAWIHTCDDEMAGGGSTRKGRHQGRARRKAGRTSGTEAVVRGLRQVSGGEGGDRQYNAGRRIRAR